MSSKNEDPLNVEELKRQAQEVMKRWNKPSFDKPEKRPIKTWQEILDNRKAPRGM